ncbi:MAG: hypothetical protein HYU39_00570 [Thaumarchaeota archaeon]|nr:hypothetical protein [Nitrososphaerota archaeon]
MSLASASSDPNYRIDQKRAIQIYLSIYDAAKAKTQGFAPPQPVGVSVLNLSAPRAQPQPSGSTSSPAGQGSFSPNEWHLVSGVFTVAGLVMLRKK